ncbi:MAG: hypothetical protein EOM55_03460, partial [Clostridia bacterium]|nr:hypothetical protein [Clostridia bacterium]
MKRYFNKISGKKTTSKIVKTGLILATVGTIVFGVMFGEQVYQSVEDMYKNTKAKTVSVYQNAKSSIEQSFEERANKIELKKQEKQEKQQDAIPPRLEIQKNAPIETGSMVDISLGAMENAEKLKNEKPASIQKKNVEIKNIEENIPVQTFIPVTDEKKIAPMPGLSLGAVQSKINSSVESVAPSENAEKQIMGKRTMSVKETTSSMGQVVSKNVDTIVKDVYSDGTESQERKSNFSYDLNDT